MRFYTLLDRLRIPGGYEGKFFLIGFVAVHLPLAAVLCWALAGTTIDWAILTVLLPATLLGTAFALIGLHALLAPVRLASGALRAYTRDASLPRLSTAYQDTGGQLLASVQEALAWLDAALTAATGSERAVRIALEGQSLRLASVAHELRQPLVAVLGFSELMQLRHHGPLGHPDYEAFVADIRSSGEHMLGLLLDVERSATSVADAKMLRGRAVLLRPVAERAARLLHRGAEAARVTVSLAVPDDAAALVNDRVILQVFLNLLGNAVRYAGPGATATVSASPADRGAAIAVTVSDDGHGMTEAEMRAALEPYGRVQRAGRARGDGDPGTGLGLPLVRSLVETSGGSFAVRSARGRGTAVTFRLPVPAAGPDAPSGPGR